MKNKVLKFVTLIIVFSILIAELGSCISYATEMEGETTVPPTTTSPSTTPTPTPDPTPEPTPTPEPDPEPEPEPKPEEPKNEVTNKPVENEVSNTTGNTTGNVVSGNNTLSNNTTENENVVDEEVEDEEKEEKPEHIVSAETNYDRGAAKTVDLSKVGIKNLKVYAINSKGKKVKVSLEEEFEMKGYNYTCKVDKDVEKLEFEYTESNKDIKVEIIGNDDLTKSNNTVIILARDTGLGRIATYQIKVLKDIEEVVNAEVIEQTDEDSEQPTEELQEKTFFEEYKTYIIVGSIVFVLIILIIIIKVKQNKQYGKRRRKKQSER